MKVRIFGPNLNDQSKGTFHVHAEHCGDCAHYGPSGKYGGEDPAGWRIEAASEFDVVMDIYPPEQFDYDSEDENARESFVNDVWFAPCVNLPERPDVYAQVAAELAAERPEPHDEDGNEVVPHTYIAPATQTYESTVEYEVDGEERKLTILFQGSPTDYYWNSNIARDFYADRVEREGGKVIRYGTHGPASGVSL